LPSISLCEASFAYALFGRSKRAMKKWGRAWAKAPKERNKRQNNNATPSGFGSVFLVNFYNNITPSGLITGLSKIFEI
jgi:hypothetical protein